MIKRVPPGQSTGGQFAATHRQEVDLQGVETPEQVYARLCPPDAEQYPFGGWRGAYYDEDMTSGELKAQLHSAYEEAKGVGLINSEADISIETHEGEVHIAVVHPDEGIYTDPHGEDADRTIQDYTDEFKKMMGVCNTIRSAYALVRYDEYGNEQVRKNSASIYFTYPQEQKRLTRDRILARPGARYSPMRTKEELREDLEASFALAQQHDIIPSNLTIETTVEGDTVHIVVSGIPLADAITEYTNERGETLRDFSTEYTELVETCEAIRDSYALGDKDRAVLGFGFK